LARWGGEHVGLEQAAGRRDESAELVVAQHRHTRERVDATQKTYLGLVHVADAGHDALIEQHLGNLAAAIRFQPCHRGIHVELLAEQVGTERSQHRRTLQLPGRQEFRDRDVERYGREGIGLDCDTHLMAGSAPALAPAVDVPRAVHPHVRPQHERSGKLHQQVLAGGPDALDGAPGDRLVLVDARQVRQDGFESFDGASGERAIQRSGSPENRVAFRHD
jgi:hypothetical protein